MSGTTLDKVVPNPPARQPKRTRDQGPGQPLIDFVINSAVERAEDINKKYNDADPIPLALIGVNRLTGKQLEKRTSSNFAAFVLRGEEESVVYEYIAYIPPKNDYIKSVDLREVTEYLKLKEAVGALDYEEERGEPEVVKAIRRKFNTNSDRRQARDYLQSKLFEGLYRMYSTDKISGDIVLSAGKLVTKDYGFIVPGNKTKISSPAIANIQATISNVKTVLDSEKKRRQQRIEVERVLNDFDEKRNKKEELNNKPNSAPKKQLRDFPSLTDGSVFG